jgi:hypothetical protein
MKEKPEKMPSGRLLSTLSGSGRQVSWKDYKGGRRVSWGKSNFNLPDDYIDNILNNFFKNFENWYILGASMDDPIIGGLGEYVQKNFPPLTPRHASAIAAIMAHYNLIDFKGKNL